MADAKTEDTDELTALRALVKDLQQQNAEKDEELDDLESNLETALVSIKTFHQQQQELYESFVELRDKYDKLKEKHKSTLWTFIPKHCRKFRTIPAISEDVEEGDGRVAQYELGDIIGKGQFGSVRTCSFLQESGEDGEAGAKETRSQPSKTRATMASKIIPKSKVIDSRDMERILGEIDVLREVNHANLLRLVDIVHTEDFLYIITGRGGEDLFEYLSRQQGPVSDIKAHRIMRQVIAGVLALHDQGFCHRDLKPENILLDVEDKIILCDYGLCTRVTESTGLTDFCGSPGFFPPEMITSKAYNGFACDVWSLGCILLELVAGHSHFARIWMSSYKVEVLSDADHFVSNVAASKDALFKILDTDEDCSHISTACKELLKGMLNIDPRARTSIAEAFTSKWIGGKIPPRPSHGEKTPSPLKRNKSFNDKLSPMGFSPGSKSPGSSPGSGGRRRSPLSFGPTTTPSPKRGDLGQRRQVSIEIDTAIGKQGVAASPQTVANRAKQALLTLPPIDAPDTPKIAGAKKILNHGDRLLSDVGLKKPPEQ